MHEAEVDRFPHRPGRRAASLGMSRGEVMRDRRLTPVANATFRIGGDVEGAPAAGHGAGEFVAIVQRLEQVPGRMAFAAMGERLDQIGAPVPLGALVGMRFETLVSVEHRRPYAHRPALIERKGEGVRNRGRANRLEAEEIGFDREQAS